MFEDSTEIFQGYGTVDNILEDCERIGADLRSTIASWAGAGADKGKQKECSPSALPNGVEEGAVSLTSLMPLKEKKAKGYLTTQPTLLSEGVQLKEYQLLGVNWLYLLYRSNLSCILADEMGMC